MIKSYLKIAFRSLLKQKGLATINILGLSIGLACFSLFLLYSVNEFSYDRFHSDADQLFRIYRWTQPMNGDAAEGDTYLPMPLGPAMKADFPDVVEMTRIQRGWRPNFIKVDGEMARQPISFADPAFFELFNFPIKYGDAKNPLKDPTSVVMTEEIALQVFGEANPVGRTLEIRLEENFVPLTVTAVTENIPSNSSIGFGLMGSFEYFTNFTDRGKRFRDEGQWSWSSFQTFVKLREGSGLASDQGRLLDFRRKYYPDHEDELREREQWTGDGAPVSYRFQPIKDIHTQTEVGWGESIDPKNIWTLLAIAAGVLLIACINFTTLAIGRSAGRAKEVGVRKVIGGNRVQLVKQFLTESVLLAAISAGIGIALAQILLPFFNEMADRELIFSLQQFPEIGWMIIGLTLMVGLLAGSYPALVLSGFAPVDVLKNTLKLGGSNLFTRSLVTLQFVVSIGLVASTLIILEQVDFMQSKHPGFNKENVLVVDTHGTDSEEVFNRFGQLASAVPGVKSIASSEMSLGARMGWSRMSWNEGDLFREAYEYVVDRDYIDVLGMEIIAGRQFNPHGQEELADAVIINEKMVDYMGWTMENAIGQNLEGYFEEEDQRPQPTVIGVVKDYNFLSLSEQVLPMLLSSPEEIVPYRISVRLQPGNPGETIASLESAWSQAVPDGFPFTYSFLDEDLARFYQEEERFSNIIAWAGGISIFLACLGLFGLAALAAINRTKEIGIRKVLGASVAGITGTLSKDFLKLVGIAIVISSPLAWYFMQGWLNTFAHRIDLPWWYFGAAGMLVIAVAFLTVGFQGLKAALANPVQSLRSE